MFSNMSLKDALTSFDTEEEEASFGREEEEDPRLVLVSRCWRRWRRLLGTLRSFLVIPHLFSRVLYMPSLALTFGLIGQPPLVPRLI